MMYDPRRMSDSVSRRELFKKGAGVAAAAYGMSVLGAPTLASAGKGARQARAASNLYSKGSYWNKRIPRDPALLSNSAQIAQRVATEQAQGVNPLSIYAGPVFNNFSYEHPIYWAKTTDPIREYRLSGWGGQIQGYRAYVPKQAKPAKGSDAHLSIIQPNGVICDSWVTDLSTPGIVRASWADFATHDGHGTCTAGQFALFAGILFPEELIAASRDPKRGVIPHALFMVTYWHSGIVWPTDREVQPSQRMLRDPSVPRFGERLYVDMTDREINSKPAHVRPIIRTMRDYGLFVGDTGGNAGGGANNGGLKVDSSRPSAWSEAGRITRAPRDGSGNYTWDVRPHVDWRRQLKVLRSSPR